jgi:hypothetical protein
MVWQQEVARDVDEEVGWHEEEARQGAATMIDERIACFITSTDGGLYSVPIFGLLVLRHGGFVLEVCTESRAAYEALIAIASRLHVFTSQSYR